MSTILAISGKDENVGHYPIVIPEFGVTVTFSLLNEIFKGEKKVLLAKEL